MSNLLSAPRSLAFTGSPLLFLAALLFTTACGDVVDNGLNNGNNGASGPRIESLEITPDTISTSETGMTDEFFTAELVVAGFEDEIILDDVEIFIQDPELVDAVPGERSIEGDTITLDRIAKSWFAGLDAGTYDIGANVSSETETLNELNLAEITVTE